MPLYRFFFGWEGSPTKINYREKGTLILSSLLEDLVWLVCQRGLLCDTREEDACMAGWCETLPPCSFPSMFLALPIQVNETKGFALVFASHRFLF